MSQTILVTGSSSGFGRLTVESLARNGHTVFAAMRGVGDRNAKAARELQHLADARSMSIIIVEMDVTDDDSVAAAADVIFTTTARLDAAVNNAGVFCRGFLEAYTVDDMQHIFNVNVHGALRVNRVVLPAMRKQGSGLLLHVSSVAARTLFPFSVPYAATKSALEALAEGYRYELASLGIDSVIVEPGAFPTSVFENAILPSDEKRAEEYAAMLPIKKRVLDGLMASVSGADASNPQDVADAIVHLIEMPAGRRPLRTVVDRFGEGAERINTTAEAVQRQLFEMTELEELWSVPT